MPHYVVGMMTVTDPAAQRAGMEQFIGKARASVAKHGGRFLVEGPVVETLEGAVDAGGGSVIEFADADSARRWFASAEYAEARDLRKRFGTSSHVLIEGIAK